MSLIIISRASFLTTILMLFVCAGCWTASSSYLLYKIC
jgi:hypothetical protein